MMETSVVLVHVHALVIEGMRHHLSTLATFQVVGEATNGQQAIQLVSSIDVDMVIMEFDLPGINGLEVARVIKRNHPRINIILLSSITDSHAIIRAIRAGISAFVPHNVSWETLLEQMYDVQQGNYPINNLVLSQPDVAAQVLAEFRQLSIEENDSHVYSPLSPRELQVLELVADHCSNKEIASSLDISNQTVKNHVSSILRKLAVNDRTQAVIYAIRQGWIKTTLPYEPHAKGASATQATPTPSDNTES